MRYLLLAASLVLAGNAMAEDPPRLTTKRLDKATPILMSPAAPPGATQDGAIDEGDEQSRAQDHNSSRSNKSSSVAPDSSGIVHRDVAARTAAAGNSGTDAGAGDRAAAFNQNSSRSNNGRSAAAQAEGADYNSSRSNKTHTPATAPGTGQGAPGDAGQAVADLDGDGRPDVAVCSQGIDNDCDDTDGDDSPAVNHNSTRSNR